MSVMTRRKIYTRVPTPLAAVGYLLAFVAVCLLLAGRKVEGLRPELLLALAPTFYSHVYNFGLSYLCVAGIGYPCVIKPVMSSSGKGQSLVKTADALAGLEDAHLHHLRRRRRDHGIPAGR